MPNLLLSCALFYTAHLLNLSPYLLSIDAFVFIATFLSLLSITLILCFLLSVSSFLHNFLHNFEQLMCRGGSESD